MLGTIINFESRLMTVKSSTLSSFPSFLRAALLLLVITASSIQTFAQVPPTSQDTTGQEQRGVGVQTDTTKPTVPDNRPGPGGPKPELVLQTGYAFLGPASMTFSPDGRLLATTTMNSSQIKLWEAGTGRQLRTLVGSSGAATMGGIMSLTGVSCVAFSPDGRLIAAGGRDNSLKLWDVATGKELRTMNDGGNNQGSLVGASAVAFSPDGSKLVSVDETVKLYDVATGNLLQSVEIGREMGAGILRGNSARTPDGRQLMLVAKDQKDTGNDVVKFIELSTGQEARSVKLPDDFTAGGDSAVAFTSDGRLLVAALEYKGNAYEFKLWDLTSKAHGRVLGTVSQDKYSTFEFSRDGRTLAQITGTTVKLWDTTTGSALRTLDVPNRYARFMPEAGVNSIAFSPDNRALVTSGFDGQIVFWETSTGRRILNMKGEANYAYEASFSNDGSRLFAGSKTIWDLQQGRGLRASPSSAESPIGSLSNDGKVLAVRNGTDNKIVLYDVATQRQIQTLAPAERASVNNMSFSPDGRLLASTYMLDNEQLKARTEKAATVAPSISPKDMQKAMKDAMKSSQKDPGAIMKAYTDMMSKTTTNTNAGIESQIKIWDTTTGQEVRTLTIPSNNPYSGANIGKIVFSNDGRKIAVTTLAGATVSLWDIGTGKQLQTFGNAEASGGMFGMPNMGFPGGSKSSIGAIAFSSDGRLMASGGKDVQGGFDQAALMSAATQTGKNRKDPVDYEKQVREMMGNTKISSPIKIWDVANGKEIRTLPGHTNELKALAFSQDGSLLVSSATDNTIKLWDVAGGRELRGFKGQSANINSLAFSPDAGLLASTGDDGGTFLWDVKTGQQLATLVSLADGGDWLIITPDGLFDGSPAAWDQILWRFSEDTFNVRPVEAFFNEFYSPGLLSDIVAGKRPQAPRDISQIDRRQPQVQLSVNGGPASDAPVSSRNINVKVTVTDAPAGARDVRLFRNGSLVKVWRGDVLKGQPSATLETQIPVIAGENRLSAYAFNRENVKSVDAAVTVNGADSLKRKGRAYVLAVGVNQYDNAQYNLKYAVADAQSFGEEVKQQQLQISRYEQVEVIPLMDGEATKENILAVLKRLSGNIDAQVPAGAAKVLGQVQTAQPEDAVVIFFAGHGTAQGQRFYLVPHDLGYSGDRNNLDATSLQSILQHSISDEELERAVEGLDASQLLLVIDACNSGQALESEEKRRGPMNSKGLAQLAYEKGMYILTAAQSFQAALEAAKFGHGFLTYALIEEGLKQGKADDGPKDGRVMVREWFDFATVMVPKMQEVEMEEAQKGRGVSVGFVQGDEKIKDPKKRSVQRPRVFYRRETEADPLVVARGGGN